ncbi:ceramidase domain-containing protein [Aquimarina sp. MMG016]|uniref:ceramidase domain-containing protein n=1 Tax=Aquimarina sp. MMG016 TaxID=2822690 RepID=UPI001B3A4C0C|nr:ceramidase domain-containing protein [Aquimarina sp. MMG016]MBQ4822133.1 ceramidase domain-containing protein [Aquimarina sp. MMG016]
MIFSGLYFSQIPNDSGPIYRETLMGRLPVEPFNTISNLIFLFIIIYFSIRIYKNVKQHTFLAFCIPVLTVGFIGGTLFHGTRSHQVWLFMDWIPILILCSAAVFYFIFKLYKKWWQRLLALVVIFTASFAIRFLPIPEVIRTSLGYVITAITMLFPIVLYLIKTKGKNKELVIFAVLSFVTAISFRSIDKLLDAEMLYMGTHWLWHLFGGISVFFLMLYTYRDKLIAIQK